MGATKLRSLAERGTTGAAHGGGLSHRLERGRSGRCRSADVGGQFAPPLANPPAATGSIASGDGSARRGQHLVSTNDSYHLAERVAQIRDADAVGICVWHRGLCHAEAGSRVYPSLRAGAVWRFGGGCLPASTPVRRDCRPDSQMKGLTAIASSRIE